MRGLKLQGLPRGFPRSLEIVLRREEHEGQTNFWARYRHRGERFKLVMNSDKRGLVLEEGDRILIEVTNRIQNTSLIFFNPVKVLETVDGQHYLVRATKRFKGQLVTVQRTKASRGRPLRYFQGRLDCLKTDSKGTLYLIITRARSREGRKERWQECDGHLSMIAATCEGGPVFRGRFRIEGRDAEAEFESARIRFQIMLG